MEHKSYYEVLRVRRDADSRQIRRAYRSACKLWHPDKNGAADATQRFQLAREAYDVLSNGLSRIQYDLALDIQELGLSFNKPDTPDGDDAAGGFPDSSLDTSGEYSASAASTARGPSPANVPTPTSSQYGGGGNGSINVSGSDNAARHTAASAGAHGTAASRVRCARVCAIVACVRALHV